MIAEDATFFFWYLNFTKDLLSSADFHSHADWIDDGGRKNINQSFDVFFSIVYRRINIPRDIFTCQKPEIPKKWVDIEGRSHKTFKIEYNFSTQLGNRLDNKSSSKCLHGSVDGILSLPSAIYEVHRVENLFAIGKFISLDGRFVLPIVNYKCKKFWKGRFCDEKGVDSNDL